MRPTTSRPSPEVGTSDELQIRHFDDLWVVEGPWLQRLMGSINFGDYESRMYFDRVLRQSGLFDRGSRPWASRRATR